MSYSLHDYHFDLPPELIAERPPQERSASRMMVIDRSSGERHITSFTDFPSFLRPGDLVVHNNTRVIPARLFATKSTGAKVEALLTAETAPGRWQALMRPGRRLHPGTVCAITGSSHSFTVLAQLPDGSFEIEFSTTAVLPLLDACGHIPLPPYMNRPDEALDRQRYQTVYASRPGAIAAPTAGLHFTPSILAACTQAGARIAELTLHTGLGTFMPVSTPDIRAHTMHSEWYEIPETTAELIRITRQQDGRIFAIGTTSVRTLESCATPERCVRSGSGHTRIFLHPPHKPCVTDALLTNFHLPESTLLMLVSSFLGRDTALDCYRLAIQERLRFYSYGDCMLIL